MTQQQTAVWVVVEDGVGEMSIILRAFDNAAAADAYVNHPDNAGHLFVEKVTVDSEFAGVDGDSSPTPSEEDSSDGI